MLKVRLVSNYADSKRLTSEVIRQFAPKEFAINFEFVFDDSYDKLFIFNTWDGDIKVSKENIFVLSQEPTWSKNFVDWNNKCAEFISPTNNQLPMMFNWTGLDYEDAINLKVEKTKPCSFIVAHHEPQDGTLYEFRNNLVHQILDTNLPIDIYGKDWNVFDSRWKGAIENKSQGLLDYHTSICIENCEQDFYVSEKFWDIIICDAIPIPYRAIKENTINNLTALIELFALGDGAILIQEQKDFYFNELNIFNYIRSKCLK
jgi:hypothetical protein